MYLVILWLIACSVIQNSIEVNITVELRCFNLLSLSCFQPDAIYPACQDNTTILSFSLCNIFSRQLNKIIDVTYESAMDLCNNVADFNLTAGIQWVSSGTAPFSCSDHTMLKVWKPFVSNISNLITFNQNGLFSVSTEPITNVHSDFICPTDNTAIFQYITCRVSSLIKNVSYTAPDVTTIETSTTTTTETTSSTTTEHLPPPTTTEYLTTETTTEVTTTISPTTTFTEKPSGTWSLWYTNTCQIRKFRRDKHNSNIVEYQELKIDHLQLCDFLDETIIEEYTVRYEEEKGKKLSSIKNETTEMLETLNQTYKTKDLASKTSFILIAVVIGFILCLILMDFMRLASKTKKNYRKKPVQIPSHPLNVSNEDSKKDDEDDDDVFEKMGQLDAIIADRMRRLSSLNSTTSHL